jgi:fumarate hydratase class II
VHGPVTDDAWPAGFAFELNACTPLSGQHCLQSIRLLADGDAQFDLWVVPAEKASLDPASSASLRPSA